jgi:hypothetical protein
LATPDRARRINAPNDFAAGLFFVCLAVLGLWLLRGVRLGTSARMGPGYLPTAMCGLLLLLGLWLAVKSFLTSGPPLERWYVRPLAFVLGAVLVFTLTIEPLGLFAAIILLVVVAAFATRESRWLEVVVGALVLGAFSTGLFIYGLGLPLSPWPSIALF